MFKKIFIATLCLYLIGLTLEQGGTSAPQENTETLTYKISFLYFIPFGTASLQIQNLSQDNNTYHFTLSPSRIVNYFSQLKASISAERKKEIVTYQEDIDSKFGRPEHNTIIYDHTQNIMEFTRGQFQGLRKKVSRDILDPLSFLTTLRNASFKKGEELRFVLNSHQSNYILKGSVQEETNAAWKIHLDMHREDKLAKKPKLTLDIWIDKPTEGKKATPTVIKAKSPIGPLTLKLVQAS